MNREELEADIIKFYKRNKSRGKAFTARHFAKYGEPESRIFYYIKKFERNPPAKASKASASATASVLADTTNASSSNLPQTSTGRVTKTTPAKKLTIAPSAALSYFSENYTNKGEILLANCQTRCETLLENYRGHDWILINQAGFSFRNNQGSHANPRSWCFPGMRPPTPPPRTDYIPKLNVCVAFSSKGISEPFIQRVSEKFDHKVYLNQFVEKKLVPFINEKHKNVENAILWADAQPAYLNKNVLAYLNNKNLKHVSKEDNPGNRVKCFSYFWNLLRNKVYSTESYSSWHADNEAELESRIKDCLKSIDMNKVKRLASDTEKRIDEMARTGAINVWSDKTQKYTTKH